jgi:hypothetical protein
MYSIENTGAPHAPLASPTLLPQARPPAALAAPCLGLVLGLWPTLPSAGPALRERRPDNRSTALNTAVFPEVRPKQVDHARRSPPLSTEGVQRYVRDSKSGSILIEVIGTRTFVNGMLVEPAITQGVQV